MLVGTVTDPAGRAITSYRFSVGASSNGAYFLLNGVRLVPTNGVYSVGANDLANLTLCGGSALMSQTFAVSAFDGVNWSAPSNATVRTVGATAPTPAPVLVNRAPTAVAASLTVNANSTTAASSLLTSVSDLDNDSIVSYKFQTNGTDGSYFILNGVRQTGAVTVSASDLGNLSFVAGSHSTSQRIQVQVFDGSAWSSAVQTTLTTAEHAPVVSVANQTVNANGVISAASLISSVTDIDRDAISSYQFTSGSVNGSYFLLNGVRQSGTVVTVSAADLQRLSFVAGTNTASQAISIQASDGVKWSSAARALVSVVEHAPVTASQAVTLNALSSIAASSLIASVTDADNDTITSYRFSISGNDGGYFYLNGRLISSNTVTVSASDLPNLTFVGGQNFNAASSTRSVTVATFDGKLWSAASSCQLTTLKHPPTLVTQDQTISANGTVAASALIASATSNDTHPITFYQFRDEGGGTGYFTLNGTRINLQNNCVQISASQLNQLAYVGLTGTERISVAASTDGLTFSNFVTSQLSIINHAPTLIAAQNPSMTISGAISAANLIASVTDADRDAITAYQFRDNGGNGGYFSLNGTRIASGQAVTISASDLALGRLTYVGGTTAGGNESISVAASDGKVWSAFVTTSVATQDIAGRVTALLSDAGVRADVRTAIADGVIDYNDMLRILNDVKAGGVSAGEFSDLRSLLQNRNNGYTISSYVYDVTNKLVNGDAANAYWTGGGTSSVALGNLAAGSSATQMDELIRKWLLGGDLPNATDCYGNAHSYSICSSPLFGAGGAPSVNDINQGSLGDCYLEAALADIAYAEPNAIRSMIRDNGNGSYGVRFYINGSEDWVTVNNALATNNNGSAVFNRSSNIWGSLIEKAYVQLNESGVLPRQAGTSYNSITAGWADPITEITGRAMTYYYSTDSSYSGGAWDALKQTFVAALGQGQEMWVASYANTSQSGRTNFVSSHAFSVIGYNSVSGNFIMRNPWGTAAGQSWNTTFEASWADLRADNAVLALASAAPNTSGSSNPSGRAATIDIPPAIRAQMVSYQDASGLGFNAPVQSNPDQNTRHQGLLASHA